VEQVVFMVDWPEINDTADAINPTADHFVVVERTELLFAVGGFCIDKFTHSLHGELRVVLANHSNVVLDKHFF
jgi:hypothetical protein